MHRSVAIGFLLVACGDDDLDPPVDELRTCTVRVELDGVETERSVSALFAPGRPLTSIAYRGDVEVSRWMFTYDDVGRILAREQDSGGPGRSGPDGIIDSHVRYRHGALSTVEEYGSPSNAVSETVEYTLDAADRVTRRASMFDTTTYELTSDGAVARAESDAIDVDTRESFTRVDAYRYEAGRLVEHAVTDTRSPSPRTFSFTYDAQPDRLAVTRTPYGSGNARWVYSYTDAGRLTRAEEDSDADGVSEWTVEITYDGTAVTTRASRDGVPGRVYSFSSECGYEPMLPALPQSGTRPGSSWNLLSPAIPAGF